VAGLNPHAGEGGLFGDEEHPHHRAGRRAARGRGHRRAGPLCARHRVHARRRRGEFDVVVAMTHDHGLIPVKYLGVEQGVNVTLGLPFVRTSPDHGTAFDIAGRGKADPASLVAALSGAALVAALARALEAAASC
jgi:4-hydroxythreonine-4-phosphate dehydrogenase